MKITHIFPEYHLAQALDYPIYNYIIISLFKIYRHLAYIKKHIASMTQWSKGLDWEINVGVQTQ